MSRLLRHWEKIVGPQLAAVAQPEAVRSRVLFITVTDDIWLQQLMFYQSQLLQNIRNVLGEVSIARSIFLWRLLHPCGTVCRGLPGQSHPSLKQRVRMPLYR